jgi:hypothetical protein
MASTGETASVKDIRKEGRKERKKESKERKTKNGSWQIQPKQTSSRMQSAQYVLTRPAGQFLLLQSAVLAFSGLFYLSFKQLYPDCNNDIKSELK